MKIKSLLILLLAFVTLSANAQNFTTNWQKNEGAYTWFTSTSKPINSLAYNPVTNKLYVAVRGVDIQILNTDGSEPILPAQQTLSKTDLAPNTFNFSKIAVTATGEIFAIALSTSGACTIHYWSSETAVKPVLISSNVTWGTERAGDTFAVTGTGDNVVMYVGGLLGRYVQVIAKDISDSKFKKVNTIDLDASITGLAAGGLSPVTTGITSDFWVSGFNVTTNYAVRKYSSTGARLATPGGEELVAGVNVTPNSVSKKFIALKHFEVGTRKFIAVTGAYFNSASSTATGEELALHIYDVTDASNNVLTNKVVLVGSTKLTTSPIVNNVVPTSDVDFKKTVNTDLSVTMQFFHVINHSGFAAHTIEFMAEGVPLPVKLSSFTAAVVNNQNQLNWSTASESNNAGFEIESSQDGLSFNKIGFVASKSSNSNGNLSYSYQDKLAAAGTTYYRLKQVDLDGKFNYSDVKAISNKLAANSISVFPNPTTDFVQVSGLDMDGVSVDVFNSSGKKVNAKVNADKVSLAGLANGIYLLKISKDGKVLKTTKVVKR